MSFKRPRSISPSSRQLKDSIRSGLCRVCGDKASFINYGALSCPSCKTFFRRNGLHPQNVRSCSSNNTCEVNMDTRRCCTVCRLAKCFSVGMSSDLIRKEERKSTKHSSTARSNTTTEHAALKQSDAQLVILNERHKHRSLSNSEWTLLANVVHAYDMFNITSHVIRLIEQLTTLSVGMQLEIVELIHRSMRSFVSSSPNFQALTTRERFSLLQRNLSSIAVFSFTFIFSDLVRKNEIESTNLFATICGSDILSQAERIDKQFLDDLTIIKLFSIILAFSSNGFIIDIEKDSLNDGFLRGTHRLLQSQNVYVELLWQYMISRYGYFDSVLRFSRLTGLFLNLIKYSFIAYRENAAYHQLVHNHLKEAKQLLITNHNQQIPLWGKR